MGPTIRKRLDGQWETDKQPQDFLQTLIDYAPPPERTMPQIAERMMTMNMASIHTTTMVGSLIDAVEVDADQPISRLFPPCYTD